MIIRLAFARETSDSPSFLVAAYDENTFEEWGKTPDFYLEDIKKADGDIREIDVEILDDVMERLFTIPKTSGVAKGVA